MQSDANFNAALRSPYINPKDVNEERERERDSRRRTKLCTCSAEALMRLDPSLCSIRTPFKSRGTASCFSRSSASLDSSAWCLPARAEAEGMTCSEPSFNGCHMSHASVTRVTSAGFSAVSGDRRGSVHRCD